jgi:hypothetical protein
MLRAVRPRRPLAALALLLGCGAVAGCGEREPSAEQQVRQTLTAFATATAGKDYNALCDRILAPALVAEVEGIGLPCEVALQRGLGDVEAPQLTVGRVRVEGDRATAEVRSSAVGQEPSSDLVELLKADGAWRVSSLAGASPPSPAP